MGHLLQLTSMFKAKKKTIKQLNVSFILFIVCVGIIVWQQINFVTVAPDNSRHELPSQFRRFGTSKDAALQ